MSLNSGWVKFINFVVAEAVAKRGWPVEQILLDINDKQFHGQIWANI